jgi:thiamine biosynthesis lipoprotein
MSTTSVHRFTAMGCEIAVSGASPVAQTAVEELFRARDRMFSRFIEQSELNRVNAAAGHPVRVSEEFARMMRVSLEAAAESEGLVDPTLGSALVSAGYDVDFALLPKNGPPPERGDRGCWRRVRVLGRLLFVPPTVQLDLNGVVKGATVDDAVALMDGSGWVSAGGDLRTGAGGMIVALPGGGTVRLARGALATSGVDRRWWLRGGREQHHLIDPRTGSPAYAPWRSVTACAATCIGADVAAKIGFLRGESGPRWLDERGVAAWFVGRDGVELVNETWRRSMVREGACI